MTKIESIYQIYLAHTTICTDTRSISKGCLFFALKGENFNGNQFATKAIEDGAAYAVIDDAAYENDDRFILVEDVLTSLQRLAKHHREQFNIPVIALTGSNGKTTTKELVRAVLAERYTVFATSGNLNNHIGVPLSILSITRGIEIAVIEMGANHQKEIEFLCEIAQPTHGLISNVGMAHLEGFGGYEGVKKGKGELYSYLASHNGAVFLNIGNLDLTTMAEKAAVKNVIRYNIDEPNAIHGNLTHSDPFIEFTWRLNDDAYEAKANLTGYYNFENILGAISIGYFFKVNAAQINKGLANYFPANHRSQVMQTDRNTIVCDFYNANPSSMTVALENLSKLTALKKIAILGDMFELGVEAAKQHQKIVHLAISKNFDTLIFIGHHFFEAHENDVNTHFFATSPQAIDFIKAQHWKDALVLLKGSRGMALEHLLPAL